ncbi:restriction endonuclease [Rhizobium sp. YJ-22]|uniref:restriction endonuclease n=1 Tax=Rhizobium sp. YJ-22 TaxID=3037556 RepID=UPI00241255E6|nr:restriction endonuclease [Rhizobium sp. YJ-22]MDG3578679.1 restriction endonuclease [Rhizobium sp. YJ-22]
MLERTPRQRELHVGFKMLCEKLLTRDGYMIMESGWKQKVARAPVQAADLLIKRPSDPDTTVVESKFYRSRRIDPVLLRNALDELKRHRETKKSKSALLIVSAQTTPAMRQEAEKLGVTLWGFAELLQMTAKTPSLADNLADLLRDGDPSTGDVFAAELAVLEEQSGRQRPRGEGAKIAADLDLVKPMRDGNKRFAQLCDRAIRYLFSEQFHRWAPQNNPEDGLFRPDLIARLAAGHDFWSALSGDFDGRYGLFLFPNQAEPLGHGAILSAERFLSRPALRPMLLVVSRAGLDAGGRRAVQEALRQRGHLILSLTLAELKDMLTARDLGDEFHDVLIDRMSEMLTDLSI